MSLVILALTKVQMASTSKKTNVGNTMARAMAAREVSLSTPAENCRLGMRAVAARRWPLPEQAGELQRPAPFQQFRQQPAT
jgi:hypothetical protein